MNQVKVYSYVEFSYSIKDTIVQKFVYLGGIRMEDLHEPLKIYMLYFESTCRMNNMSRVHVPS